MPRSVGSARGERLPWMIRQDVQVARERAGKRGRARERARARSFRSAYTVVRSRLRDFGELGAARVR